ncbi:helix-turn-helix domain-containing protein [Kineococcus aurantiacus]|uniref:Transcriptional regulator with XRE-family HTH domain n=1 Tax=Kineococcus aurantiacus TaxID=37633 RepID=A0A7Y9DKT2_9ACTN|nr:transcriptional regulator with XRE-family HTH domain [Kineococcus aurantiacus]
MSENLLGEFLRARRELVRPAEVGLPDGPRRRVPGLRREEVAMLAGVSAEYYVRLERGRDRHPSPPVLDALARVLGLDAESRDYLASLAGNALPARGAGPEVCSPTIAAFVERAPAPAFVLGRFTDVLAANEAAHRLHGRMPGNVLRHLFLDPGSRALYPDWAELAAEAVGSTRGAAVRYLDDPRLTRLVGELSLKSAEFARLWAQHGVRAKSAGTKRIAVPLADGGRETVTVGWEALEVASSPGQVVVTYHAAGGSRAERVLAGLSR